MRIFLAVCLAALLGALPLAQAQNSPFPPCAEAELVFVLALRGDYDVLVNSLSADENSIDSALAYSAAQIQWREDLWSGMPPCAEAIDVAVLLSHNASDLGAMTALTYAGVSLSLNRYKDRLFFEGIERDRLEAQFEAIAALVESGDRPAQPGLGERRLAACTDVDVQSLILALLDSEDLIVAGSNIRSRGELLDYISAKLDWRDRVWDQLPACAESVEIGRLMGEAANDLATAIAYSHAEVSPTKNPFAGPLQDKLNELGQWLEAMLARSSGESEASPDLPELDNLPRCSDRALAVLAHSLSGASDLVKSSFDIESTSGLLAFSADLIAWRNIFFSRLPYCAEAVETGLLVTNFLADIVAALALGYADIPADDNPFWEEISAKMPQVHEALNLWTDNAEAAGSIPDSVTVLPPAHRPSGKLWCY